jgi:hypothetical protein
LFVMGVFEIGSHELFAQASFEPQSSWSLSPELLGLQAWDTGTWPEYLTFKQGESPSETKED